MYVCVLGILKGKFSKQMKKKYLVTELHGLSAFFRSLLMYSMDQVTHTLTYNFSGLLFVCEWIGPGYTSINSIKNAFNPIICLCNNIIETVLYVFFFVDRCFSFYLFSFWTLWCLPFFNLRILIAPFVSSNSFHWKIKNIVISEKRQKYVLLWFLLYSTINGTE
jgi:hypothetical protein